MTEYDWLRCFFTEEILEYLRGKTSDRKIRLLACGLVRREIEWLHPIWGRVALETAERYADGQATLEELRAAQGNAVSRIIRGELSAEDRRVSNATKAAAWVASEDAWYAAGTGIRLPGYRAGEEKYLRDVIGNPFRPVSLDPAWLRWNDGTVAKIAQSIYDERRFENLPILADALEDAGCDNADILAHCRQPGEHVRGCWVVDLLLGKE